MPWMNMMMFTGYMPPSISRLNFLFGRFGQQTLVFDQLGLIILEIILDHLNSAEARGDSFLVLKQPVMSQGFADFHDFNMPFFGFPKLAFGQCGG